MVLVINQRTDVTINGIFEGAEADGIARSASVISVFKREERVAGSQFPC